MINFKFYLDIEKHHIETKIEKNIRELGGVRIFGFLLICFYILFVFALKMTFPNHSFKCLKIRGGESTV